MEPRAAVAQWQEGKLTVWTGTQNPTRVRGELMEAFRLPAERVRVIVPDAGGGFGGKHTGEVALEAARLAKGCGQPVSVRWTREEEFVWAYFRPAGLIEVTGGLDAKGGLTAWKFVNYNSGGSALETPYTRSQRAHAVCFVRRPAAVRVLSGPGLDGEQVWLNVTREGQDTARDLARWQDLRHGGEARDAARETHRHEARDRHSAAPIRT